MKKVSYPKLIFNAINYVWFAICFDIASIVISVICLALILLALIIYPWDKGYRAIDNTVQRLSQKLRNL
jgi:uncharacterized Tic20 family protein